MPKDIWRDKRIIENDPGFVSMEKSWDEWPGKGWGSMSSGPGGGTGC